MALVVKDRVKETTTTTGTGTITLAGAVDGFQSFSAALADGDTTYYAISETSTGEWEVGLGTFTATGTTLARTTVLASSNAGSAVSLTAEADVFITQPAGKSVFFDGSGDLTLNQDPTSALHAATKEYVDTIAAAGLHYHDPVRVEQEGNLSATYDNGTAGVGATLTNNSTQAALSIDGVTLSLNDRVLIYEQTNAYENGVYTVTDTGSASTNWVLTRSTDTDSYAPSDPDSLGQGDAFFVLEGAAGAGELYVMNTEGTITFGTTGITFTQVASTAVFTAGDGLTLTGTTFAVGAGTGVTVNANDIAIGQAVGTSDSPTFAGMTTTADITFGSNDKASFGTTLDIYSDGTDSYVVEGGTGNLYIDSADLSIRNAAGTATMASFDDTGSVTLNHNNSTKLTTQSYGIDVTGNVQSDGLIVDGDATFDTNTLFVDSTNNRVGIGNIAPATALDVTGSISADGLTVDGNVTVQKNNPVVTIADTGTSNQQSFIRQLSGTLYFDGQSGATADGSFLFRGYDGSTNKMLISYNGDISFYEDTGVTPKFFWDASAESLGIGSTTTGGKLRIAQSSDASTGGLHIAATDGNAATIGRLTSGELTIRNNSIDTMSFKSGNVGIGTSSPAYELEVEDSSSNAYISIISSNTSDAGLLFGDTDAAARGGILYDNANNSLAFRTNTNTERMRIDSSGNLLVGRTDTNVNTVGALIGASGYNYFTRDGGYAALFNRKTSDGDILQFRKDGTTVGSIGTKDFGGGLGSRLFIGEGDTALAFQVHADNSITPIKTDGGTRDNVLNLGAPSHRFKDLYLSGDIELGGALDVQATTGTWIRSDQMTDSIGWNTSYGVYIGSNVGGTHYLRGNGTFTTGGSTYNLWHSGNDGSGSGLDADLLDGLDSTAFIRSNADDNVSAHTEWQDNYSARFGNGADFRIFHNGTNNYLRNYNHAAGDIFIQGEDTSGVNHNIAAFYSSNAAPYVGLFYDGTEVLTTTSTGVNVVGTVTAGNATFDNGTSTTVDVVCDDNGTAGIRLHGASQGTGFVQVGQSTSYGGGMYYNGDGSPAFASGETADTIGFYRLSNGTRTEVFSYPYSSNNVTFNGNVTASAFVGNGSGLTNLPAVDYFETDVEIYSDDLGADIDLKWFTGGSGSYGGGLSFLDSEVEEAYVRYTPQQGSTPRKLESHVDGDLSISTNAINSQLDITANGSGSDITLTAADNIILDGEIDLRSTGTLTLTSNNNVQQNNLYAVNGVAVRATYVNGTNSYEDRIYSTSKPLVPYWFSRANYLSAIGNNPYGWRLIYMRDPGTGSDNLIRSDQWNAFTLSVPLKMASDERIKEDIQEIENPLDKVNKLNGYTYTWTTTKDKDAGVIAQEVEKVMPELVTEMEAEQNDEGFNRKTVNYNGLVGLLISAVKEQQKQIDELKAKIEGQ